MKTGERIKALRLKKGMTQEILAEKTEVSTRTIQRIENGDVDPRAYTLQMIAKALEVDFDVLAESEPEDKTESLHKTWLALLHLSGLLPLIFPSIMIWNRNLNKTKALSHHYRAVISMQLCILVICTVGLWVYWKAHEPTPFWGGLMAGALVALINAINVMNGKGYINPFFKAKEHISN